MRTTKTGRLLLAVTLTGGLAVTAGCAASGGDNDDEPTTLTIANSAELVSFDPTQAADGLLVQYFQPVFDSLIRKDPAGDLIPMLATEWSYNDDFTELTLLLRDDVTFTDGTAFDADAAVVNIQRQIDTDGVNASAVASIESVSAADDTSLVIDLSQPDPGLLSALATTVGLMASPDSLESEDFANEPVGSGPYILDADDTVAGDTYTYTANPDYWDADLQQFGTIVIKTMTDPTARMNAIKSGQVQGTPLDLTQFDEATASGVTVQTAREDWLGLVVFDRDGTVVPALGDERVRAAIAHAIDSESIIEAFRSGHAEPTDQVFNIDGEAYLPELDDEYPYDVEEAKQLMSDAGYADGFSVTLPDFSALFGEELFAVMIDQLGEIGITVELESLPIPDLVQGTFQGKYAIALTGGAMGTDWNTINTFFLPTSLFNPMHSTDETFDGYLETIRTSEGEEQVAAYQDANRFIVEQNWATPFFRGDQIYASTDEVVVELQFGNIVPYIYNFSPAS